MRIVAGERLPHLGASRRQGVDERHQRPRLLLRGEPVGIRDIQCLQHPYQSTDIRRVKTIRLPWRERGRLVDDAHGHRATDRALRIGQRRKVLVHRFVTRGTIEVDAQASVVEPLQRSWSGRPVGGRPRADNADSSESLNLCAELGQLQVRGVPCPR